MWTATSIDGQYRQMLLTPRELDLRQLPAARANWINPAFIYTHGYGVVLAPVSQITPDGLPVLLIENAPPEVKTKSLKLTRPELYYGEVTHEPVFVHTVARRVQLPERREPTSPRATKARAAFRSPASACAWPPRSAKASPTSC